MVKIKNKLIILFGFLTFMPLYYAKADLLPATPQEWFQWALEPENLFFTLIVLSMTTGLFVWLFKIDDR